MQQSLSIKVGKSNPWKLGLAALGVVGTAAIAYTLIGPSKAPDINPERDTVPVQVQSLPVQIKANGLVQPLRKINISPKEAGSVTELLVREGDSVESGQVIARMDDKRLQAQVNQSRQALARAQAGLAERLTGNRPEDIAKAEAEVTRYEAQLQEAQSRSQLATAKLSRQQPLAEQGAISRDALDEAQASARNASDGIRQAEAALRVARLELDKQRSGFRSEDIDQARAQVAEAEAQFQISQIQLDNAFVRAPFGGIITRRFTDVGDFVAPTTSASASDGATSASIAELSSGLEVEAKLPEASIAQISPGQTVEVRSDSYPDQVFRGEVRLIAPRALQENNITTFRVKVSLQTGLDLLKAGMNTKLAFIGEPVKNALVVPLATVVTQPDGAQGVWRLTGAAPSFESEFQVVRLGSESGSQAQILEGLKEGDRIFVIPPAGQVIPGVDNTEGTGL
ncbi:MAG: efflux RND transporter periplasmic adaptor subunit [Nodosilinea sp.]